MQKVKDNDDSTSVSSLCALAGYSRQAFYACQQQKELQLNKHELIIQQVMFHRRLQKRIGTRKLMILLQDFLKEQQIEIGRDGLFALLRNYGLLVRKRRSRVQTTLSRHHFHKYNNLIKGYTPLAPGCLWVSDITYLPIKDGFVYLSLITDAYSRKIVGYELSRNLQAYASIQALQMALSTCTNRQQLIHHSDRGFQYCSKAYVGLLQEHQIRISMTENGNPRENAIAERVNGILKEELLKKEYQSFEQAKEEVIKAIAIYNELRPHSSCDMLTPNEAHTGQGTLKKHWKNYYKQLADIDLQTIKSTNLSFDQIQTDNLKQD